MQEQKSDRKQEIPPLASLLKKTRGIVPRTSFILPAEQLVSYRAQQWLPADFLVSEVDSAACVGTSTTLPVVPGIAHLNIVCRWSL